MFTSCELWKLKYYYEEDPQVIDVRWGEIYTQGVICVPLNEILVIIHTPNGKRIMKIEETYIYMWINSIVNGPENLKFRNEYKKYLENYYPEENAEDGEDYVYKLVNSEYVKDIKDNNKLFTIVSYPPVHYKMSDKVVVFDGVHRTAIAKTFKHNLIRCRVVNEELK